MKTSEQTDQIAAAMARAQQELRPAIEDMTNPVYKSKYADLSAIIESSRVYGKYGIAVLQEPSMVEGGAQVVTRLMHDRGQWIELDPLVIPLAKRDAHGCIAGVTYAKRVSLASALAISSAEVDDDGNTAVGVTEAAPRKVVEPAPPGYDQWLLDIEATALNGIQPLQDAWAKSDGALRKYLTDTNKAKWDKLKEKAAKVKQQAVPA